MSHVVKLIEAVGLIKHEMTKLEAQIETLKQENERLKQQILYISRENQSTEKKYTKYMEQWINECLTYTPNNLTPFKVLCKKYQTWVKNVYDLDEILDYDLFGKVLLKYQIEEWGGFNKENHQRRNPKCNVAITFGNIY